MIQMMYVGGRRGDFRLAAQPTRTQYHIPGAGGLVELDQSGIQGVNPQDVPWFRSVNQGRDFKVVDQPAPPPPAPPPPEPAAAPPIARTATAESRAFAPDVMEAPEREIAEYEPAEPPAITGPAQRLAEEHGIDWAALEGSGQDGTILVSDVREAIG